MKPIPTDPTSPHYTMTVNLDTVNFGLAFNWNDRASRWYMDVNDSTGSPIYAGVCVVQSLLLLPCNDIRRPPGDFIALNSKNPNTDPGLADLGADVTLFYLTRAEVKSI